MTNRLLALVCVGVLGAAGSALASDQDFTLRNDTGEQIDHVWVAASDGGSWSSDMLGSRVIPVGERARIRFAREMNRCHFTVMVQYSRGERQYWNRVDLCNTERVTLHWSRERGTRATFD